MRRDQPNAGTLLGGTVDFEVPAAGFEPLVALSGVGRSRTPWPSFSPAPARTGRSGARLRAGAGRGVGTVQRGAFWDARRRNRDGSGGLHLPVHKIPEALIRCAQHAYSGAKQEEPESVEKNRSQLNQSFVLLRSRSKRDLRCYKEGTLLCRTRRRRPAPG